MPFANARALRESGEVASTALTQGKLTTGTAIAASTRFGLAADSGGPKPEREVSRSTISKCFGTPPVCEANHIADQSQCSCQNELLRNRHTRRVHVAGRQHDVRSVMDSWLGKDLQSPVPRPSKDLNHFTANLPIKLPRQRR